MEPRRKDLASPLLLLTARVLTSLRCALQEVAAAMHRGLLMPDEEKRARHQTLYQTVSTHTSHTWAAVLAKTLLAQIGRSNLARQTPYIPRDRLEDCYRAAKKRLFLLDYDVRRCVLLLSRAGCI